MIAKPVIPGLLYRVNEVVIVQAKNGSDAISHVLKAMINQKEETKNLPCFLKQQAF